MALTDATASDIEFAVAEHRAGRLDVAEAAYRRFLASAPSWKAAFNLSLICDGSGRSLEALDHLQSADRLRPDHPETLAALGRLLRRVQRPAEAIPPLRRAIDAKPNIPDWRLRLGLALLMVGELDEGWIGYEQRPPRINGAIRKILIPEWQGEPLNGRRLLVYGEQGLGDEIQMARFISMLRDRGASQVGLAVNPALVRLVGEVGADVVTSRYGTLNADPFDAWVLIASLPQRLGIDLSNLPAAPYLTGKASTKKGGVGVVTGANPKGFNGAHKTLPKDLAAMLLASGISLSPADTGAADMQDTADIIAGLDLVVTVDTAVAHLAGAMGKPVWILLPFIESDWRWLVGRDDSPWYPSARLFRQSETGGWPEVVENVRAELGRAGY